MQLKENYIFTGDKDKNSRAPLNYSRQSSSNRGSNNNSQLMNSINASNQKFIDKEKGFDHLLNNSKNIPNRNLSYSMRESDDNDSEKVKSKKNSSKKQQHIEMTTIKKNSILEKEDKDVVMNPFTKKKTFINNDGNDDLKKQDSFKVDNRRLMKKEKIVR